MSNAVEIKFDKLRARYMTRRDKQEKFESQLRHGYGPGWSSAWLTRPEWKRVEALRTATSKAAKEFFDYLQKISPRDWSYDVPAHWLYENLSFADAIRPIGEPLSVVPPLSYGATKPRT